MLYINICCIHTYIYIYQLWYIHEIRMGYQWISTGGKMGSQYSNSGYNPWNIFLYPADNDLSYSDYLGIIRYYQHHHRYHRRVIPDFTSHCCWLYYTYILI